MEMIENKNNGKRRMPKATKMVLAAALAVGCVLSIAAGLPPQVYNFVSGGTLTVLETGENGEAKIELNGAASPITAEDGRLWLEADGQKIDITGKVDENTPYIYEHTDPATGNKGYLVVGGTVDDYGWAEFYLTEDGICSKMGENAWSDLVPIDGQLIPMTELTDEQRDMLNEKGDVMMQTVNRPWLDKAVNQLSLDID